jgi:hypothetical protein
MHHQTTHPQGHRRIGVRVRGRAGEGAGVDPVTAAKLKLRRALWRAALGPSMPSMSLPVRLRRELGYVHTLSADAHTLCAHSMHTRYAHRLYKHAMHTRYAHTLCADAHTLCTHAMQLTRRARKKG